MSLDEHDQSASTILVVEDEIMLLMVVGETLRDAGHIVWEAENSERALAILNDRPEIELMITDVKMPGINGYQLADLALAMRPALKVLVMTGYAHDPFPAKHAGIPVLYKPFDFNKLPDIVGQMLHGTSH